MIWETKKLGDILSIQNGYAFDSKLFHLEDGMPLIRIRDIKKGDGTETRYSGNFEKKYVVKRGDLLIGMDGEFGCYEWKGGDALLNQRVCRLQDFENTISPRFLLYGINGYLKAIEDVTGYTTVKHISSKQITNIEFPLPPLEVQEKIVIKLDAIFEEINKASVASEANSKNTEALFQSYLTQIYEGKNKDWDRKKISEIASIKGGKRIPKGYELTKEKTAYPYLRVTNFGEDGGINTTDLRYVSDEVRSQIKNYIITSNDVYISIAGTIGRTGIVSNDLSGSLLTENACRLVFNEGINNRFVYFFTKSSNFINQTVKQTRTTAQPKLALSRLGEIALSIPCLEEQIKIVNKLDLLSSNISSCKSYYAEKINKLAKLKHSVLQEAFSGKWVKE